MTKRAYTDSDPEHFDIRSVLYPYLGRNFPRCGISNPAGNPEIGSPRHTSKTRAMDDKQRTRTLDLLESMKIDRKAPIWKRFEEESYLIVVLILTDSLSLSNAPADLLMETFGKNYQDLRAEMYPS